MRSKPPDNAPAGYFPPWPQPNGVFSTNASGTTFNRIPFLTTLRDIYEKVVLGDRQNDEALELGASTDAAFAHQCPCQRRRYVSCQARA